MVRSAEEMGVLLGDPGSTGLSDRIRARALRVAGIAIILLSAGAALLPAGKSISSDMIGGLLIAAGLIETVAGLAAARGAAVRDGGRAASPRSPGSCSSSTPKRISFRRVVPIIGWLLIRSVILASAQRTSPRLGADVDRAFLRAWISCSPCC